MRIRQNQISEQRLTSCLPTLVQGSYSLAGSTALLEVHCRSTLNAGEPRNELGLKLKRLVDYGTVSSPFPVFGTLSKIVE